MYHTSEWSSLFIAVFYFICYQSFSSILGLVFNGSGKAIDNGPPILAEDYLDIMGMQ